jgi:hypothetical protein
MKLSLILAPMMLLAAPALANDQPTPNAHLGTDWSDDSFIMPFMLVRNENVVIDVHVERGIQGEAIACRLTSGNQLLSSDNGSTCHLSSQGFGLRHLVLQVINLDEHGHQIYITANRGRTH